MANGRFPTAHAIMLLTKLFGHRSQSTIPFVRVHRRSVARLLIKQEYVGNFSSSYVTHPSAMGLPPKAVAGPRVMTPTELIMLVSRTDVGRIVAHCSIWLFRLYWLRGPTGSRGRLLSLGTALHLRCFLVRATCPACGQSRPTGKSLPGRGCGNQSKL